MTSRTQGLDKTGEAAEAVGSSARGALPAGLLVPGVPGSALLQLLGSVVAVYNHVATGFRTHGRSNTFLNRHMYKGLYVHMYVSTYVYMYVCKLVCAYVIGCSCI